MVDSNEGPLEALQREFMEEVSSFEKMNEEKKTELKEKLNLLFGKGQPV
jgi:hypothetical protein